MAGRPFWHEAHLELPANLAPVIRVMLDPGRRSARRDGWLAGHGPLLDWLDQLDRLSAVQRPHEPSGVPPGTPDTELPPATPTSDRWLTTAEAAAVLGVSERRVRQLSTRLVCRQVNGRRMWLEADVIDEADAREGCLAHPPRA